MSQTTPTERQIGRHIYRVYKLPPLEAHDALVDITTTVLPAVGNVFASMMGGGDEEEEKPADLWEMLDGGNPEQLAAAFNSLAVNLAKNKPLFRSLIDRMAQLTEVQMPDGTPRLDRLFAAHFQGDLPGMYKWFAFALEVQFGNFFDLLPTGTGLGDLLKNSG